MSLRSLPFVCCLAMGATGVRAQDVEGGKDHPLLTRYPGSTITQYAQKAFDEYDLPLGKADSDGKLTKTQHLEGKVTHIVYTYPEGRSVLEIYRNYEQALTRAGFAPLFACRGEDQERPDGCGSLHVLIHQGHGVGWSAEDDERNLVTRLSRAGGNVYLTLHVSATSPENHVMLDVVEVKPMEADLIRVDAAALASDLARTGHASVYGIYFDTGKWDVKPESDAALREIAALLKRDAALKLNVVGHTDNVGELVANLELSRKRATAVVQVLTTKYAVPTARLRPDGVGPLAPVASNDTDEGRGRNRRVELVKQ